MPLVSGALVHLDETSIVGSPVTEWTNGGSGGSGYDLDVVLGTAANLTRSTINGLDAVTSDGTASMETTAGQNITGKMTVFSVIKINVINGGFLMDARDSGTARSALFDTSGKWAMNDGATLSFGTMDTNLHIWISQFNKDSTSKLTIANELSDLGSVTGNMGSTDFEFAAFFSRNSSSAISNAAFCEYVLYNSELSAPDVATNKAFLINKWFVAPGGGVANQRLFIGPGIGI